MQLESIVFAHLVNQSFRASQEVRKNICTTQSPNPGTQNDSAVDKQSLWILKYAFWEVCVLDSSPSQWLLLHSSGTVNSNIMSFNGFISVSRAVQIPNTSFGELLRKISGYCYSYKDVLPLEKGSLPWKGHSEEGSAHRSVQKDRINLQILLRGKGETGMTFIEPFPSAWKCSVGFIIQQNVWKWDFFRKQMKACQKRMMGPD